MLFFKGFQGLEKSAMNFEYFQSLHGPVRTLLNNSNTCFPFLKRTSSFCWICGWVSLPSSISVPNASSLNSAFRQLCISFPGSRMPPGMAHCLLSVLMIATNSSTFLPWSRTISPAFLFHRVTIGSPAWLGPHRPSMPRPFIPVRPRGFRG